MFFAMYGTQRVYAPAESAYVDVWGPMSYGFRLFYFNITKGFHRTNLALSEKIGAQTPEGMLAGLLDALCAEPDLLRIAMPSLRKTSDGDDVTPTPSERGDKAIKWVDWQRHSDLHLSARVRFGRVDGHDLAMGPTGDVDIRGMAPSHRFRVEILLPKHGETGVFVAEDIDRTCPAQPGAQWLGKQSQLLAEATGDPTWYRMTLQAFTDEQRLRDLIQNSRKAEIQLKRHGKSGSGKKRQSPLTIKAPLEQPSDLKKLLTAATAWASGDKQAVAQSAAVLSEIVGADVAALDPDQASVNIEDASGQRKTIRPDRIDEVFIYPIGDGSPTPDVWKQHVLTKLSALRGTMPFDVVW